MPRPIKTSLKPTKFEDLDPRTQEFLKKRGLKKETISGGKKVVPPSPPPKSPSQRRDEKKAETREQRITLKDIGMAKGGRAGFKSGSKGCKLAMKGKGRAYGKNS